MLTVDKHQVLTRRGWKSCDELEIGEDIYTLNHSTGLAEWSPLRGTVRRPSVPGEALVHMFGRLHHSTSDIYSVWPVVAKSRLTNPDRRWASPGSFKTHEHIEMAVPCSDLPQESKYIDDLVRLVALYVSCGTNPPHISITKSASRDVEAVRELLTRLFTTQAFRQVPVFSGRKKAMKFVLNKYHSDVLVHLAGTDRVATNDFILSLTSAQLEIFFATLLDLGDGLKVSDGIWRFWQSREERLSPIELAAILSGRVPRRVGTMAQHNGLFGLTVTSRIKIFKPTACTASVQENVQVDLFCPVTDNNTWLAKNNGTVFFAAAGRPMT